MNYPTDINDSQWQVIKKFLNTERKRKYELRQIWNAIQYVIKTGCQWRMLPLKTKVKYSSLKIGFADGGYRGQLKDKVAQKLGMQLEIVKKPKQGFVVLPKRWIMERSFAWINNHRRNAKDYEFSPLSSEAMIQLSFIKTALNRIWK